MKAEELAVVQGWQDTRITLSPGGAAPAGVVGAWALGSLAVTVALLRRSGRWRSSRRRSHRLRAAGSDAAGRARRRRVPALPQRARARPARAGLRGRLHGPLLAARGGRGLHRPVAADPRARRARWRSASWSRRRCSRSRPRHTRSATRPPTSLRGSDCHRSLLLAGLLPHALLELTALFLPLAAWTLAARREAWEELLAATFVTVALAVPMLVAAALIETYVTPDLLAILSEA